MYQAYSVRSAGKKKSKLNSPTATASALTALILKLYARNPEARNKITKVYLTIEWS
jgi:hypothetical protein